MIVDLVRQREKVSVDFLSTTLKASRETIRRDLSELATKGHVRKYHGGAVLPDLTPAEALKESPFRARMAHFLPQKRAIAQRAAELLSAGDSVFIDTGSTTIVFAEALAAVPGLSIVTNAMPVAQAISAGCGNSKIFLLGGELREQEMQCVGPFAIEQIHQFHAQHAFLTAGAVSEQGIMDFNIEETEIARAMVAQSTQITILADSSKLAKVALFRVCELDQVDRLVTDAAPDDRLARALADAGVEVIVAPASY